VGPAADTYALGSILYEMLTGRPPFHASTTQETVQQLLSEEPVPPARLQPNVSRDLETICLKCLEKEPGRRYAAANALADDLRRYLAGESILARRAPAWELAERWARRRPAVAALGAVSAAAVLALLIMGIAYNTRLQRQRAIADSQRDAARIAQNRAEADFRLALDAVRRFYTQVSENRLASVPTLGPLRVELLQSAHDFYEQIARERPDDPDVQAELARAGWRLALMVADSRSVIDGIGLLSEPIATQERLARQHPDRPDLRSDLARSYNNLGILHRRNNQNELGADAWERALALREQLVFEHPTHFLFRRDLAQSLNNLANWYRQVEGQAQKAEETYRRTLTILEQLTADAVDDPRPRTGLPLSPFAVDHVRVRYDLANTHQNLADFYLERDLPARAVKSTQKSQELVIPLVRDYPDRPLYRRLLARTHFFGGQLHQTNGELNCAAESWRSARSIQEALVRDHPDDPAFLYDLGLTLRSLSAVSAADSREKDAESFRKAAQDLEERLLKDHPESNAYYFDAALVYASFSPRIPAKGPGPTDCSSFAEDCITRALGLLVDAERSGYFQTPSGIRSLRTERALDHLRPRDAFKQLLARLRLADDRSSK
jgi:hypothetical protein